jgi:hypothetical protein
MRLERVARPTGRSEAGEEAAVTAQHDHELEVLEDDQTVPPRPEEAVADAERESAADASDRVAEPPATPVSGP